MTTTKAPVAYFEIASTDTAKAEAFYGEIFGWDFEDSHMGSVYRMVHAGDDGVPGGLTTAEGGLPGNYAIFSVAVPDVGVTCEKVTELGGRVLVGPAEVPDSGGLVYANLEDHDGNHFGVFCPPAG